MESGEHLPAEELWRLTVAHAPIGMALISTEGEFMTVNLALCDLLGYPAEVLSTMVLWEITHPDDIEADLALVRRSLAGEISSFRTARRCRRADGTFVLCDLSVALLRDESGVPLHFISQVVDAGDRHAVAERLEAAEEAVTTEQRKVAALIETAPVGLVLLDADGAYQTWNARHEHFVQLAFPDGHSHAAGQVGYVYDSTQSRQLPAEELPSTRAASGEDYDDLVVWVGKDPESRRAVSVSARSIRDASGAFRGATLSHHDVTDALRVSRVKDEFVALVSHELRTPLAAAMAYLELLEDSPEVQGEVGQHVRAARRNVLRLSHLVADLLFSARAKAGSFALDPHPVDLTVILEEALRSASIAAADARVDLEAVLPRRVEVVADGARVRQVVDNLLANVVAYAGRDRRACLSVVEHEGTVEIVVSDDGEGIAVDDQREVFTPFFRGQNARRHRVAGTGLGLSIVRTIAEAHGGSATLESTPGEGTTVRVTLAR